MLADSTIGMLLYHERQFVADVGHTFLAHAHNSSFPTGHATAIFILVQA